jgi:hypothetical protein
MERLALCCDALYNEDILDKMNTIKKLEFELNDTRMKLERYLEHAVFFDSRAEYNEKTEQKDEAIRIAFHEYIYSLPYCREVMGHRLKTPYGTTLSIRNLTTRIASAYVEVGAEEGWATQEAARTFSNLCVYLHANPFNGTLRLPVGWKTDIERYGYIVEKLVAQVIELMEPPLEYCFVCCECDDTIVTVTDDNDSDMCENCYI